MMPSVLRRMRPAALAVRRRRGRTGNMPPVYRTRLDDPLEGVRRQPAEPVSRLLALRRKGPRSIRAAATDESSNANLIRHRERFIRRAAFWPFRSPICVNGSSARAQYRRATTSRNRRFLGWPASRMPRPSLAKSRKRTPHQLHRRRRHPPRMENNTVAANVVLRRCRVRGGADRTARRTSRRRCCRPPACRSPSPSTVRRRFRRISWRLIALALTFVNI